MRPDPTAAAPESLLRHASFVRRLAREIVSDDASVDDVAQETWLAALSAGPDRPELLRSWLGSVARRLALRRRRGDVRRTRRERAVARAEAVGLGPVATHEARLVERVTEAVLALDEPYRSTVLLRYYDGLGPTAIAERHGVSTATVASRLQRAHAKLRERLAPARGRLGAWIGALAPWKGALFMSSSMKLATASVVLGIGALVAWRALSSTETASAFPEHAEVLDGRAHVRSSATRERTDDEPRVALDSPGETTRVGSSQVAPTTGAVLLRVVWDDTREPAPGRVFDLLPWNATEPLAARSTATTDAAGAIRLEALPAGPLLVYGRLGGGGRVTIEAGVTAEVELAIPRGVRLTGRVVTPDGRGVADARIWLSDEKNDADGGIVARSGTDGRFALEGVGPDRFVAAFAESWSPAEPLAVAVEGRARCDVELVLGPPGGTLRGVVVDADGQALPGSAGARVRVESLGPEEYRRADGTWAREFAPWEIACDEAGRFEFAGLPLERVSLAARAPGRAPVAIEVDVPPRGGFERLALLPAGVVTGVVRDADGRPVAGAQVAHGPYAQFTSSFARSNRDGRFRLENLPLGPVELVAEHAEHGRATARFTLRAGEPVEWSPRLASARLSGRVVDELGRPRAGFLVEAVGTEAEPGSRRLWSDQVRTDDDGAFVFANAPDQTLRVAVHPPDSFGRITAPVDARPGDPPLTIVVRTAELPSASLRGRVLAADSRPLPATVVLLGPSGVGGYAEAGCDVEDGSFAFAELVPGEYTLRVRPDGLPERSHAERLTLTEGRVTELDPWILPELGTLTIVVPGAGGAGPFETATVYRAVSDAAWVDPRRFPAGEDAPLWPGDYVLRATGPSVCLETARFSVTSGATTVVRLRPEAGSACRFRVVTAQTERGPLVFTVLDAEEQGVADWSDLAPRAGTRDVTRHLRPGEHVLLVRRGVEEVARVPFTVPADGDGETLVVVTLE